MMLFSRLRRAIRISIDEMWSAIVHVNEFLKVRFVAVKRKRDKESLKEVIDFLPEAYEYHNEGLHNLLRIHYEPITLSA